MVFKAGFTVKEILSPLTCVHFRNFKRMYSNSGLNYVLFWLLFAILNSKMKLHSKWAVYLDPIMYGHQGKVPISYCTYQSVSVLYSVHVFRQCCHSDCCFISHASN